MSSSKFKAGDIVVSGLGKHFKVEKVHGKLYDFVDLDGAIWGKGVMNQVYWHIIDDNFELVSKLHKVLK